ncbi:hypothetical protein T492DRAFT_839876 [Pavlovales sp. CCMP2436]|nr:hypothetical protein T492DRAFT_839876 [Pavlovales sp. CCMP2436]
MKRKIKCAEPNCGWTTMRGETELEGHMRAAHTGERLGCGWHLTAFVLKKTSPLIIGRRRAMKRKIKCAEPGCGWTSTRGETKFDDHMRSHTGERLGCGAPGCDFKTAWSAQMYNHRKKKRHQGALVLLPPSTALEKLQQAVTRITRGAKRGRCSKPSLADYEAQAKMCRARMRMD